eukprot:scaffold179224_cov19-Tisochrysis_lutea.AAC.1
MLAASRARASGSSIILPPRTPLRFSGCTFSTTPGRPRCRADGDGELLGWASRAAKTLEGGRVPARHLARHLGARRSFPFL